MSKHTEPATHTRPALSEYRWSSEVVDELADEELYPSSDGQPMAESDVHRDQMIDLINQLIEYYRDRPDVYVTGNLFF